MPSVIAETQMSLCCLKTAMGMNMITFTTNDQLQLKSPELSGNYKNGNDVQVLIQIIDKYCDKHFDNYRNSPLIDCLTSYTTIISTDSGQLI